MSAVCIDWNTLDNYIEVSAKEPLSVFWGTFASQKSWSDKRNYNLRKEMDVGSTAPASRKMGIKDAVMPEDIAVLEAWQFFIPKLKDEHIERRSTIPARDMVALGMYFGV